MDDIKVGDIIKDVESGYTFDPSTVKILKIEKNYFQVKVLHKDITDKSTWNYSKDQIIKVKKRQNISCNFFDEILDIL